MLCEEFNCALRGFLKIACKTVYTEGKNSELVQQNHKELFYCQKKKELSKRQMLHKGLTRFSYGFRGNEMKS